MRVDALGILISLMGYCSAQGLRKTRAELLTTCSKILQARQLLLHIMTAITLYSQYLLLLQLQPLLTIIIDLTMVTIIVNF